MVKQISKIDTPEVAALLQNGKSFGHGAGSLLKETSFGEEYLVNPSLNDTTERGFAAALSAFVLLLANIISWYTTNAWNGISMQSFSQRFFQDHEKEDYLVIISVTTLVTTMQVASGAILAVTFLHTIMSYNRVKGKSAATVVKLFWESLNKPTFPTEVLLSSLHSLGSCFTNFGFVWGKASLVQIIKLLEPFQTLAWARFLLPSKENKLNHTGVVCGMTVVVGAALSLIPLRKHDYARPESILFATLSGLTLTLRNVLSRRILHAHTQPSPRNAPSSFVQNAKFRPSSKERAPATADSETGLKPTSDSALTHRGRHSPNQLSPNSARTSVMTDNNLKTSSHIAGLRNLEKSLWQFAQLSFLSLATLLPLLAIFYTYLGMYHRTALSSLHMALAADPAVLLWHPLYNISSFVVLGFTNAVAHSLLNAGKRVFSILLAILWFQESLTASTWAGLLMVGIGGGWYTFESKTVPTTAKSNKTWLKPSIALCLLAILYVFRENRRLEMQGSETHGSEMHGFERESDYVSLKRYENLEALAPIDIADLMPGKYFVPPAPMKLFDTTDPAILQRHQCIAAIRAQHRDRLEPRLLFQGAPSALGRNYERPLHPVLYVDPALHVNVGDNLLTEGVLSFFLRYNRTWFKTCNYVQAQRKVRHCTQKMTDAQEPKLAAWHPGGNWGDRYLRVQNPRISSFSALLSHHYKILGFPQSLWYSSKESQEIQTALIKQNISEGLGGIDLDTEEGSALARERVTFTWREEFSYTLAMELYPFVENVLVPDIAFQLGPYDTSSYKKEVDIVFFFRSDGESVLEHLRQNNTAIQELLDSVTPPGERVTFRVVDWDDRKKLEGHKGDQYFTEAALKLISLGKVLVCDRLHAFILAYLAGVPVVYIDQKTQKIRKTSGAAFKAWYGCQDTATSKWAGADNATHALQLSMALLQ